MGGLTGQLVLVAVLVLVNAVFAGSEVALISLREGQLRRLREDSSAGRILVALAGEPNRYLSTIQIAITLAGFLASATAAVTLARPLVEPLGFLGEAARPVAIVVVTVLLTFVTLVLGELAPKRLAMQRAEGWALAVARPLSLMTKLAAPVVWVLSVTTDAVVRMFGGDPERGREETTAEEVRDMLVHGDLYRGLQRRVITGALDVGERKLREVLTPRTRVVGLSDQTPVIAALEQLAEAGHSRAPVWTDDLDDAERYVSLLSLVGRDGVVGDHAAPAVVLPETLGALAALSRLQGEHRQMALVVGEHGTIEGIVTVEDLVEEVVGDIQDEHDRAHPEVVRHDDTLELPGEFPLHELPDLDMVVPDSDQTTIGGLLSEHLGRVPEVGDTAPLQEHTVEVLAMRRRSVTRVRIRLATDTAPAPDTPDSGDR